MRSIWTLLPPSARRSWNIKTLPRLVVVILVASLAAVFVSRPSRAELCALDPVPAATLLLPYFELGEKDVSGKKLKGENTILYIRNNDAAPSFARVTLWTELSVPTLAFDVFLTGYDAHTINLGEVFRGNIPGPIAEACVDQGSTGGAPVPATLTEAQLDDLRLAHKGKPVPSLGGLCAAIDRDDKRYRGYVTIDNTGGCPTSAGGTSDTAVFPSDPGYFVAGGTGVAIQANVLSGDATQFGQKSRWSTSTQLVAIEAQEGSATPGSFTFYGRYVGYDGSDGREPLATIWGVRYANDSDDTRQTTRLVVWRDAGVRQDPFDCAQPPAWYPLDYLQIVAFDEQEDAVESMDASLAAEANRTLVGGEEFSLPFDAGWIYLNLHSPTRGALQSWVGAEQRHGKKLKARGLTSGNAFDSACDSDPPRP